VPAANDSIAVTPGTGATVATHSPGDGREYQVVMVADATGQLDGSNPRYRFISNSSVVGANKVHADLFNGVGSGKIVRVRSVFVYVDYDTAVTGVVAVEVALTRTTTVGTGGTAATLEGTVITAPAISKLDSANPNLPAQITARLAPAGGATAGAYLGSRWVFTEETSAGTSIAGAQGADLIRNEGADLFLREGEGLRVVQGAVASVGAVVVEVNFELI
jgi:hypothetical protein